MGYLKQINEYFFRQTQNIMTIPIKIYAMYIYIINLFHVLMHENVFIIRMIGLR